MCELRSLSLSWRTTWLMGRFQNRSQSNPVTLSAGGAWYRTVTPGIVSSVTPCRYRNGSFMAQWDLPWMAWGAA
jgi:hypothetical protein